MTRYRKKPLEVDAIKINVGTSYMEIRNFFGKEHGSISRKNNGELYIETLEGKMHVSIGDYIIKGVEGEFYPCKPDIFSKSYEKVVDL